MPTFAQQINPSSSPKTKYWGKMLPFCSISHSLAIQSVSRLFYLLFFLSVHGGSWSMIQDSLWEFQEELSSSIKRCRELHSNPFGGRFNIFFVLGLSIQYLLFNTGDEDYVIVANPCDIILANENVFLL